jgi:uncharacterized protein
MNAPSRLLTVGLGLLLCGAGARAQQQAPLPLATIGSTRQFDVTSAITGEAYRIQIFIPSRPPPPAGYPVLYVLDGNVLFGTYASAARTKALARETEAAVVVGIASGEGEHSAERTLDFTISQRSARDKAIVKDMSPDQHVGGAEAFFRVIQQEIRPHVAQVAPVDDRRAALLGWSLGGLFVTHTLFAHPDAFATFIAISPSLWFNERAVLRDIPAFEARVSREHLHPRFFLAAGGREEDLPAARLATAQSPASVRAEMRYYGMVHNPRALNARLAPYFRGIGASMRFRLFPGDTHNSIPWSMVNPAVDFAFPLPPGA